MKQVLLSTVLACCTAAGLFAQASGASISADLKKSFEGVKKNLLKSAEKMPDADYGFKPQPDIRSFAEVLSHVVMAQGRTCAAANGEKPKPMSEAGTTKADIMKGLEASFEVCDKAYGALTDSNASETITSPRGQMTRMGMLVNNYAHDSEQYGLIAMYLRAKGLVPPSSEKK